jgi:NAD(P)-dependent dehydrogenase (short-subunit alcohol dehydrogenase family)
MTSSRPFCTNAGTSVIASNSCCTPGRTRCCAGRGMGVDITQAALAAGYAVVATGRNADRVGAAIGAHDDLLVVELDVTDPASAEAAVAAAVERFGRIDVLVNNAGNFYAGFFEEISAADFRAQVETNLFGPLNVTRAVLPVLRGQHAGHIVTISSTAGLIGQEFCTAYAASKFALEGWMESLTPEIAPFGIGTVVEPGFFRTDLLTPESTSYAEPSIDDYALGGRRRRRPGRGAEGARPARPGGGAPGAVLLAGPRGRNGERLRPACERVRGGTPLAQHSHIAAEARLLGGVGSMTYGMDRSSCEQL